MAITGRAAPSGASKMSRAETLQLMADAAYHKSQLVLSSDAPVVHSPCVRSRAALCPTRLSSVGFLMKAVNVAGDSRVCRGDGVRIYLPENARRGGDSPKRSGGLRYLLGRTALMVHTLAIVAARETFLEPDRAALQHGGGTCARKRLCSQSRSTLSMILTERGSFDMW